MGQIEAKRKYLPTMIQPLVGVTTTPCGDSSVVVGMGLTRAVSYRPPAKLIGSGSRGVDITTVATAEMKALAGRASAR